MKKQSIVIAAFSAVFAAVAADIEQVIVRQQWPWSTDVKVEYTLSGVSEPVDIQVSAYTGADEASKVADSVLERGLSGSRFDIRSGGRYSLAIDPLKVFGESRETISDFRVVLTAVPATEGSREILYKVLNLDEPYDVDDVTRGQILNGERGEFVTDYKAFDAGFTQPLDDVLIWTEITNGVQYRTTHLVLRKISAKNKTFLFRSGVATSNVTAVAQGKGTTTDGIPTTFTNDFYLGVFELTQTQWKKVTAFPDGSAWETNELYAATRPVDRCYYSNRTRGSDSSMIWPEGNHADIAEDTYFGILRRRYGALFDFPTEAMWEFAYRAGTVEGLYTGEEYNFNNFAKISRQRGVNRENSQSSAERNCDLSDGPNIVGGYFPNAWGMYDMVGNVRERCLDVYDPAYVFPDSQIDPRGAPVVSGKTLRVARGGSYIVAPANNRYCPVREGVRSGDADKYTGIRVCLYPDMPVEAAD